MKKYILIIFLLINTAIAEPLKIVTQNFPPFQYMKNGNIDGPMYELMKAVCNEAQLECIFQITNWTTALKLAEQGEADLIFSINLDEISRKATFIVSGSIIRTSYCFFVTSTSQWKWTGNIKDLNGMTVGAYGPSGTSIAAFDLVAKNPTAQLVVEPNNLVVFQKLFMGGYGSKSAVVINSDVGEALLDMNSIGGAKHAGVIKDVDYGFGMSRKSNRIDEMPKLLAALRSLQKRGIVDKIFNESEYKIRSAPFK